MTTLLAGHLLHVPRDPFAAGAAPAGAGALEAVQDGAIAVRDGRIVATGPAGDLRARFPDAPLEQTGGYMLPGLVDGHVHYPQLPVMGVMGLRLLDWLRRRTLPFETRYADADFARAQARTFLGALARNGTTSAMVFGAHQPDAMAAFFEEAAASGLRVTAGLTLGDRELPPALQLPPAEAVRASRELIARWHGRGRLRYAVTPRFAVATSDAMLAACGELLGSHQDLWFTTHLNETPDEIAYVRAAFPAARDYLDAYDRHGLIGPRSVLAHDVHPAERELARLGESRAVVCHCPGSNQFIGSGLFPMRRHLAHGVRLMLGSDVGGGPGFGMPGEARTAYQTQMLLGEEGAPLDAERLLWLLTAGGAAALGLSDQVGDLSPGKEADLVVLRPPAHGTLAARLQHAVDAEDALAALLALSSEADVARTLVAGETVWDARTAGAGEVAPPA
ncbi:MAG: guanine deaminase [Trueperaceae bacterium]|nr:guanine deaminase [Trueperaceae bacterium]